jgi:hypothetical protein
MPSGAESVLAAVGLATLILTPASGAPKSDRLVNVNGHWSEKAELDDADAIAGHHLPDGYYRYDGRACSWGKLGDPKALGRAPCDPRLSGQPPDSGSRTHPSKRSFLLLIRDQRRIRVRNWTHTEVTAMCRFATMIMILALSLGNQLANAAEARMCKL